MIVIHHNKDLDGFASGAICKLKYPDAKLIGWDYADPIPDFEQFKGEDIIMIDITFPIDKIKELGLICDQLTVMDHHVSFKKEYDERTDVWDKFLYIYKIGSAACEIGWKYLFSDKPIPYAVTLLGRYDTWRQNEGDWEGETLPFQYYMRTVCTSADRFPVRYFEENNCNQAVDLGKIILLYQEQQDTLACQRSSFAREFKTPTGPLRALCLNTRFFSSNTLKSVYNPDLHDVMIGFEYTGTKWSVSLRSDKNDVDVSILAKFRGGGGHKGAAGFECDIFENIF